MLYDVKRSESFGPETPETKEVANWQFPGGVARRALWHRRTDSFCRPWSPLLRRFCSRNFYLTIYYGTDE